MSRRGKNPCSEETAERIFQNWNGDLRSSMAAAGIKSQSERRLRTLKAFTEKYKGQPLEVEESRRKFRNTRHDHIPCPSHLDISNAKKSKRFLITSATNNSTLNKNFFKTLENFCEHHKTQLLVIPLMYQNDPTMSRDDYFWPREVHPYTLSERMIVSKNLVIDGGANIRATAVNPLSGMESNSGVRSAVYGHPQVALEPVGTPKHEEPKQIMTTGSVTARNYRPGKTGTKAEFHHSASAVLIQMVGQRYIPMSLHWDGRGIAFLDEYWTPEGVEKRENPIAALVQGDSHAICEDKKVTTARRRLRGRTSPLALVWHDLHDHRIGNHHNTVIENVKLAQAGLLRISDELDLAVAMLNREGKNVKNYIIGSNHDEALDRHLNRFKAKEDPINAPLMWELSIKTVESGRPAFECYAAPRLDVHHEFVNRDGGFMIAGVDISQHGDLGVNGARGSANGLAKTSRKTMIGHSHSARIVKGCYQVGVSSRDHNYARGYSTWSICDGVIYSNGKRALIFYLGYKTIADHFKKVA